MKKRRRRLKKQISAGMAVFCLFAAGCLALLITPLFSVRSVSVTGNCTVTAEDIIKSSGIVKGTNIFRVSLSSAEDKISSMNGISSVKVKRRLPSSVRITVREGKPLVYIENKGDYVGLAADGTVVAVIKGNTLFAVKDKPDPEQENTDEAEGEAEETQDADEDGEQDISLGAAVVTGMGSVEYKVGKKAEFADEKKAENLEKLMTQFLSDEACHGFTSVDMSLYESAVLKYENSLTVRMGSFEELGYKLKCFKTIMSEQLGEDAKGTLDLERLTYSPKND